MRFKALAKLLCMRFATALMIYWVAAKLMFICRFIFLVNLYSLITAYKTSANMQKKIYASEYN
jgi:hypothetical protein